MQPPENGTPTDNFAQPLPISPYPVQAPYPPSTAPEAPVAAPALVPASYGARFGNWAIDRLLSICWSLFLSVVLFLVLDWAILHGDKLNTLVEYAYFAISYLLFQFLYYFILEKHYGRTFGKALTGTQVIGKAGQRPRAAELVGRTIARAIPFDEWSILFMKRKTWHDELSNTLVVPSRTLPAAEQERGTPMKIFAILLLLPVFGLLGVWPVYQSLTGGERVELSQNTPADLRLVAYSEIPTQDSTYEVLTYQGNGRTVEIHRLIAGYDFDPHQPCLYMTPTKQQYDYAPIDPSLSCTEIAHTSDGISAYKVSVRSTDTAIRSESPDYYISKPPYRYAIKVTHGSMSDDEIKKMTTGYRTYTARELHQLADTNAQ